MTTTETTFPAAVVGRSRTLGHFVDDAALERYTAAYRDAFATLPPARASTVSTSYGVVRAYRFETTAAAAEGGRAPVVLLAGRDSATPMWRPALVDLLALGRPVVSLDSVGGPGCSAQTAPLRTSEDQAAWVAEAIAGLGHERAHLVGHSLGGWLAVQVALRRPEVVASVTALDPPRVFAELDLAFVAAGLTAAAPLVPARLRRRLVGWIAGAPMSDDDPVDRLGWAGLRGFRARQAPPGLPSPAELAAIGVPLLVLLAGRSRVQSASRAAQGAEAVPGAQVEVWPEAGHCLHAEQPLRLATRLRELLDATGS